MAVAQRHKLIVIEDACQAFGASYNGRKVGGFGNAGYFSFGTLKVFSTLNGGMIVTNEDEAARSIRE